MVVMASVKILSLVVVNLIIVSAGGVLAQDLQLEGDLTREPENGLVNKNQVMKCLQNGEIPEGLQWYKIKDDEEELITSGKYYTMCDFHDFGLTFFSVILRTFWKVEKVKWPLYKNVSKMDDAESNFAHPYLVTFFVKWLFDPSQPSKKPSK